MAKLSINSIKKITAQLHFFDKRKQDADSYKNFVAMAKFRTINKSKSVSASQ